MDSSTYFHCRDHVRSISYETLFPNFLFFLVIFLGIWRILPLPSSIVWSYCFLFFFLCKDYRWSKFMSSKIYCFYIVDIAMLFVCVWNSFLKLIMILSQFVASKYHISKLKKQNLVLKDNVEFRFLCDKLIRGEKIQLYLQR